MEDRFAPKEREAPEPIGLGQMAERAGRGQTKPIGSDPDIAEFKATVFRFIDAMDGLKIDRVKLAMAKSKAEEMVFWMRSAREG